MNLETFNVLSRVKNNVNTERKQVPIWLRVGEKWVQPGTTGNRTLSSTHPHTQNDEPLVGSSRASYASKGFTFFLESVQSTRQREGKSSALKPTTLRPPKSWIRKTAQSLPFYSTRGGRYIIIKTIDSVNDSPSLCLEHACFYFCSFLMLSWRFQAIRGNIVKCTGTRVCTSAPPFWNNLCKC